MTIQMAYQQFVESLGKVYDTFEAKSVARIVFEDEFRISNFERQDEFESQHQTCLS